MTNGQLMKSGCMCESVLYTRVCAKIGEKIHHVYYLCITCVLPAESHAERKIVDRCLHLQTTGVFSAVCARSKSHTTPNTECVTIPYIWRKTHINTVGKKKNWTQKKRWALLLATGTLLLLVRAILASREEEEGKEEEMVGKRRVMKGRGCGEEEDRAGKNGRGGFDVEICICV